MTALLTPQDQVLKGSEGQNKSLKAKDPFGGVFSTFPSSFPTVVLAMSTLTLVYRIGQRCFKAG